MSMRLYQIADKYQYLLERLFNEETGEINLEVAHQMDALEDTLQEKAINKVRYMKGLEAEHNAIKAERQAMQQREKALANRIEYFKSDLLAAMEKSEISEISCPQFQIRLKKNPHSVDQDHMDKELIPEKYHKIKIEFDIAGIKEDIKSGVEVPGARLIQTNRLEIK